MRIIGGSARGRKLRSPPGRSTRPALDRVREAVFVRLGPEIDAHRVLDLYAGVGAFGLESLSRGARHAPFVENAPAALSVLRRNIEELAFSGRATVLRGDALAVPDAAALAVSPPDLVFVDPPFALFRAGGDPVPVLDRVRRLLEVRPGDPGRRVLLRLPAAWRDPLPLPASWERVYGESRLALFDADAGPVAPG